MTDAQVDLNALCNELAKAMLTGMTPEEIRELILELERARRQRLH
jgi:hypothetical protein